MTKETTIPPTGISSSTGQHHSELQNVGGVWVDNRENAWIRYDLGAPAQVNVVGISFDQADTIRYTFSIEVAPEDGSSWTPVIVNRVSAKGLGVKQYKFRPHEARFVKMMVHDNNSADRFRAAIDLFQVGHVKGRVRPKPKPKPKKSKTKTKSRSTTRKR